MTGQCRASALPEQSEAVIEDLRSSTDPVRIDTAGYKFDCQSDPVELAADPRDDRGILVAQLEAVVAGGRAVREKLHGRERQRRRGRQPLVVRWTLQRHQSMDVLALDTQRLPARREDVHL